MTITAADMARRIDYTLLAPDATPDRIDQLCDEALRFGFGAVCINPIYVRRVSARLEVSGGLTSVERRPAVVSVAGFPLGGAVTATKVDEARRALDNGASEIDMVAALGALIAGDRKTVRRDIEAVARVVHSTCENGILKVILETAALTEAQIILGCRLCAEAEADFVKTSTGFHPAGGATVDHVRLLHRCASPLRVKASGGIRTAAAARAKLEAGAARLGNSWGAAIVEAM